MKSPSHRTFESKKEHRKELARAPIGAKLAKLDSLRERTHAIRPGKTDSVIKSTGKGRAKPSP